MPRLFLFKRNSRILESEVREYFESLLQRQCGAPVPYTMERFSHATNPNIYKVQWNGEAGRILRFHRLGKSLNPEWYFRANEYMSDQGFRVPEIVFKDRTWSTRLKYGAVVSLERFIEGDLFRGRQLEDHAVIKAMAQLLHRMHAITRERPGLPWKTDSRPYFDILMARIEHYLEKALKAELMPRCEAGACRGWFEAWRPILGVIRDQNLVHGDFNWRNVIIEPSGEMTILDFESLHFGMFELDLAESERSLLADSAVAHDAFMREYFRLAGDAWLKRYERHLPFFSALVNLEKASSNAMKALKVARGEKHESLPYGHKSLHFLDRLREIMEKEGR